MDTKKQKSESQITSVVAKQDNGDVQITYTIADELIQKTKKHALEEFAQNMTVPGFRKGKAPISTVEERTDPNKLTEHILQHILPNAFTDSVREHKLNPAMYPRFETIKVEMGSDFEIRAITCELPEITLGDYKKKVAGELRSAKIIVPGKDPQKNGIDEGKIISALLSSVELKIPNMLIEEEVNGRLSSLLARVEKLGLQLEGYLQTVGKTPEGLREEYKKQSEEAIKTELLLNKIAQEEDIKVTPLEVDEFIKTTGSDPEKVEKQQKESLVRVLQRRKALEKLATL